MPTSNQSSDDCEECNGTGVINKVVGSGQPGIIGTHMEMSTCSDCIVTSFKVPHTPEDKPEYISTDGRTPVDHYIRGGYECIDIMRAISTPEGFQAHCHLTAFKYLYRLGEKDDPINEVKKARDYLMWLQQSLEEESAKNLKMTAAQRIQDGLDLRRGSPGI